MDYGNVIERVIESYYNHPLYAAYLSFRGSAKRQAGSGDGDDVIIPQFRQWLFLRSPADITIVGGAAGGGKTYAALLAPLRYRENPKFGAVVFRNTFRQIEQQGGLWDTSEDVYEPVGGVSNLTKYWWTFESGARVRFGYLDKKKDRDYYRGAQIPCIIYDQLEQVGESSFFYLLSRNRSMSGVRPHVLATCNPDADSWLARFLDWWIADDGYVDLDRAGKVRFFIRHGDNLVWDDKPGPLKKIDGLAQPKSVCFIPSTVFDNQKLLEADPAYLSNLMAQLPVDRERLLGHPIRGGNWKVRAGAGDIFNRDWFHIISNEVPEHGDVVLFWDFASTEKELEKDDPDWTAAVLMLKAGGEYYWLETIAFREGPGETMRRFKNRSRQIAYRFLSRGYRFYLRWEIEPGSAAKRENEQLMAEFDDIDAEGVRSTGDKLVRARPLAQAAYAGKVHIVWSDDWTEGTLNHLHNQPDKHDDIMDAGSGAYGVLAGGSLLPAPASAQAEQDPRETLRDQSRSTGDMMFPDRDRSRIWGRYSDGRGRRGRRIKP